MGELGRPEINISSIRVAGIGGLGMIVVLVAVVYSMPAMRTFAVVSLVGGVLVAGAVLAYHRWKKPAPLTSPIPPVK